MSFYEDATDDRESSDSDKETMVAKIQDILDEISSYTNIGAAKITVSETEDKDWINNWKQYAKPFRASKRIAICPTWIDEVPEEILAPEVMDQEVSGDSGLETDKGIEPPSILRIDPGIAFGTGSHETTKLCIQALDELLSEGDAVLDVGCGSGILSIAALLLGAGYATAIDIDEIAVAAAKENFDTNHISGDRYDLMSGNLLADDKLVSDIQSGMFVGSIRSGGNIVGSKSKMSGFAGYDIVVANILPDVIVPLTSLVPGFLKNNGIYITSGILATRESEVREALETNGFRDIVCTPMGEWVSLVSRK